MMQGIGSRISLKEHCAGIIDSGLMPALNSMSPVNISCPARVYQVYVKFPVCLSPFRGREGL